MYHFQHQFFRDNAHSISMAYIFTLDFFAVEKFEAIKLI